MLVSLTPSSSGQATGAEIPTPSGQFVATFPIGGSYQVTDSRGNTVLVQVYSYAVNPVAADAPQWNYFLIDFAVTATPNDTAVTSSCIPLTTHCSATSSAWSMDTQGLVDSNGPSITLGIALSPCSQGEFYVSSIQPGTTKVSDNFGSPVTLSVGAGYKTATATLSTTFYPKSSESQATNVQLCNIDWGSGVLQAGFEPNSYFYEFQVVAYVNKTLPAANLSFSATGNFYACNIASGVCGCNLGLNLCDHVTVAKTVSYTLPPITTITSSPIGAGYVTVNGTATATPSEFVGTGWYTGQKETLSAQSPVSGGTGVRYLFSNWSNGGNQTQLIIVPSSATTYSANYHKQYLLTISNTSSGSFNLIPGTYWKNDSQTVQLTAAPAANYNLSDWIVDGNVEPANSTTLTLTMNSPHTIGAAFSATSQQGRGSPTSASTTSQGNSPLSTSNLELAAIVSVTVVVIAGALLAFRSKR